MPRRSTCLEGRYQIPRDTSQRINLANTSMQSHSLGVRRPDCREQCKCGPFFFVFCFFGGGGGSPPPLNFDLPSGILRVHRGGK